MLEAVNSTLQSAPFVRASAEQISSVESFAANPDRTQKAAVAPYVSPYIHMDVNYNKAVLQIRDSDTGDVLHQFPTETKLQAGGREIALRESSERAELNAPHSKDAAPSGGTTQDAQAGINPDAAPAPRTSSAPQPQQIAAFQAAARAGNSNAGNVTLFA